MADQLSGIEELRKACNILNRCTETFNSFYTAEQLLQICRMHRASEWDILPSSWTPRQTREALRGIVPKFNDQENPIYSTPHEKFTPVKKG